MFLVCKSLLRSPGDLRPELEFFPAFFILFFLCSTQPIFWDVQFSLHRTNSGNIFILFEGSRFERSPTLFSHLSHYFLFSFHNHFYCMSVTFRRFHFHSMLCSGCSFSLLRIGVVQEWERGRLLCCGLENTALDHLLDFLSNPSLV